VRFAVMWSRAADVTPFLIPPCRKHFRRQGSPSGSRIAASPLHRRRDPPTWLWSCLFRCEGKRGRSKRRDSFRACHIERDYRSIYTRVTLFPAQA
jgi:hypothetical protein